MNKPDHQALDDYFADARGWASDQVKALDRSRRIAWYVAAAAGGTALILALAILAMLPLKRTEPHLLLVDRTTGYVQTLRPLEQQRVAPDTALTQALLAQYVMAREGFSRETIQNDYRKTMLWSQGSAQSDYQRAIQVANPGSPLNVLPRGATLDVIVKSVSSLSLTTSLVRFDVVRRDAGSERFANPQPYSAVVTYGFSPRALTTGDRYLNPLGFTVTRYRRSEEAIVPAPTLNPSLTVRDTMPRAMP